MTSFGLDPRNSHELYRGDCGQVCIVISTRDSHQLLRQVIERVLAGLYPASSDSHLFLK